MATKRRRSINNENSSLHVGGAAFTDVKWLEIQSSHGAIIHVEGDYSARKRARNCKISSPSASKAVAHYDA